MSGPSYDAVVIGSGPNGLSAAITMARAGHSVIVHEAEPTIGGGARTAELTLPGFLHDLCSGVHPLAVASPFFRSLPLREHGLEWIHSPAPVAHPLADGSAVLLERSVEATAEGLAGDRLSYRRFMEPLVENWPVLESEVLRPWRVPRHPLALGKFAKHALRSAARLACSVFATEQARALFAGLAAHSMLPLEQAPSAAFGLVLGITGHRVGWPIPRGGAQKLTEALASYLRRLGGQIVVGTRVRSLRELPSARTIFCDVTPRQLLQIAGDQLPNDYRRKLEHYRYGLAAFKIDWALRGTVPWKASACGRAVTVHLGGTLAEISQSERTAWQGGYSPKPFVLLAQPSLYDPGRAPAGQHTLWGYCHVPGGSTYDMTERIEAQIERFAPGFRDLILARQVMAPIDLERHNANLVGGDINGGAPDLKQLFLRPTAGLYSTPIKGLYICSSSTPPGGGVHGLCGYFAARVALQKLTRSGDSGNLCW